MLLWLKLFLGQFKKEDGQGMVEYALLIGLIAVVVIAVLVLLGPAIANLFSDIIDSITGAGANNAG